MPATEKIFAVPRSDPGTIKRSELSALIDDRPGERVFRVNRRVFTDPTIFDLEMKHIFEGGWVFLGLHSQIPQPHDFFTTNIGRVPVIVTRDGGGEFRVFVNSCPHKGARICQLQQGNAKVHVCPYHSWSFDSAGRNKAIKGRAGGHYGDAFDQESHDLYALPRIGDYRGFLFGSLNADVPSLDDYLGEARRLLDLIVDQSASGLELVPGAVTFTYEANWKLQLENCSDQYHFSSVHPSYLKLLDRRAESQWMGTTRNMWDPNRRHDEAHGAATGGSYNLANGHVLNWRMPDAPDALPLYEQKDALAERVGEAKRDWMFFSRNLTIFPNVQFAENASSQLRIIRPLSVDRTEMRTFCMAPIGESAEARRLRIRQYEDFFNPSGLATPDDAVVYEACQEGYASSGSPWLQGYSRGICGKVDGGNDFSRAIGLAPEQSITGDRTLGDETIFHAYYRAWRQRLADALPEDAPVREGVA